MDNCFQSAAFLLKRISCEVMKGNIDYFQCKSPLRGMACPKKADIITKLCPLMNDENSRMYWAALPDNINSIDLADQRESGECVYTD